MENNPKKKMFQRGHYVDSTTNKVKVRGKMLFVDVANNQCEVHIALAKRNFCHEKKENIERVENILDGRLKRRPIVRVFKGKDRKDCIIQAKETFKSYMQAVGETRFQEIDDPEILRHFSVTDETTHNF